jgi:hypothetical protein
MPAEPVRMARPGRKGPMVLRAQMGRRERMVCSRRLVRTEPTVCPNRRVQTGQQDSTGQRERPEQRGQRGPVVALARPLPGPLPTAAVLPELMLLPPGPARPRRIGSPAPPA